jgi:hypothetical protein
VNFQDWVKSVDGRTVGNGQCWGLAEDYNIRVIGGSTLATAPSPHAGYACGVWDGYGSNGVEKSYTQAPATALAQAGWIPVWKWGSANAPLSHIAVALGDVGIGVDCMTQNPGVSHRMTISKAGLYGYLVPRTSGGGITLASDNSSNPIQGAVDAVNNVTHLADQISAIQSFFATPGIWQRIGLYTLGALILLAAAVYMFKDSEILKAVTK